MTKKTADGGEKGRTRKDKNAPHTPSMLLDRLPPTLGEEAKGGKKKKKRGAKAKKDKGFADFMAKRNKAVLSAKSKY